MYILGISCFYHDAAAAILKDGVLLAAAEEERFSRKKHDFGFPQNAIDFCLAYARVSPQDLDYVVFYEKPFLKFERLLLSIFATYPKSCNVFKESMITWLLDKLWTKNIIKEKVGVGEKKIIFVDHHLAHAASAFFCSPFEESAILTVDGVGEWTTTTIGWGKGTNIVLEKEIKFPHSLGLLYSAFTAFLGFEVNEGEYKVMGMAPYGRPRYVDKIYKLIEFNNDGSFWLDMSYFSFHHSTHKTFNGKFEKLFGKPREAKQSDVLEPYYSDIAASIQKVLEEILLKIVNNLYKATGKNKLCIAGGVALNSVANGRILRETPFEELYVQPQAGDGGGAVGAALYAYHCLLKLPRNFIMEHAYWGKEYSQDEIKDFLDREGINYRYFKEEEDLLDEVATQLSDGAVIGWSQDRFEWGPRALGNRSILADPRRAEMKDIVNRKIKFREAFRPFAPSVIVEKAEGFFDLNQPKVHYPSRFMLYVMDVKLDKRKLIPAVTHVDGTARPQTVFEKDNPRYYKLIKSFEEKTGIPVVLNTSFNLKGEPIVNSPEDAFRTFSRSGLDVLVLGDFIIKKR